MDAVQSEQQVEMFADRRADNWGSPEGRNRRQFGDVRTHDRPEVVELSEAIDRYKMVNRRRFITFEELYDVMSSLGYHK